ncbi:MAG: glycosyltransferase family 39 protein [Solirubrobacteraceae bacterium]
MSTSAPIDSSGPVTPAIMWGRLREWAASRRGLLSLVAGVILVYISSRLGWLWRFPPYFDESFYAHEAPIALAQPAQRFISLNDSKGPLFLWLSFIPLKLGFAPLTSVRLVAQASGLWTMGMTGILTRRLADTATALVAMSLFAIIPLWVVFTAIGFDEPLVAAAAMTALYLELRLVERPTLRDATLLGIALGVGLLTKQSGEFALVLIPASLLLFGWRAPGVAWRLLYWLGAVALAVALGYLLYSVERLSPLYYERADIAKSLGQYTPIGTALRDVSTIFQRNWPGYRSEIDGYVTVPLVVAFGIGIGTIYASRPATALVLLCWIVIPLGGIVLIANRPLGHYLVPALSPAIIVIAIGVTETARALRARFPGPRARTSATCALAALSLVPALIFDVRFVVDPSRIQLPAYDDRELITDDAAGSGWSQFVTIIERRAVGLPAPHVIAYGGLITFDVSLLIGDPGGTRYPYVPLDSPPAGQAEFVVVTDSLPPPCSRAAPPTANITVPACSLVPVSRLRLLSTYQRPRGGSRIALYEVDPSR